jgi:hypothetical protein
MMADDCQCFAEALDLLRQTDRPADPELARHLEKCPRCRSYLVALDVIDGRPASSVRHKAPSAWRWIVPVGATVAVAAGVFFAFADPDGEDESLRGVPSVQLFVNRGDQTSLWNGSAAVQAGDVLSLRIGCEGMAHVTVASTGGWSARPGAPPGPVVAGEAWSRLHEAGCPGVPSVPLPFTLTVDDEPNSRPFVVVLSRSPLDDAALQRAATNGARAGDVWTFRFDLPREVTSTRTPASQEARSP